MRAMAGAVLITIGVLVQVYERHVNKSHSSLKSSVERHLLELSRLRNSPQELPGDDTKIPGQDLSFRQVEEILAAGLADAERSTRKELLDVIDRFEEAERKKNPFYLLSYALIIVGTIMTVL